jgi:phosphate transport system substrate-binding protein
MFRTPKAVASLALAVSIAGCDASGPAQRRGDAAAAAQVSSSTPPAAAALAGSITVDGSSTVLPVSTAIAEAFRKAHPDVQISVHESGTGGGFKRFCAGAVDIAGASRAINAVEIAQCESAGIELIELPFGFDSLAVVANPANAFATCLTVGELTKMWAPAAEGKVTSWHQVRASFPAQPLVLFGPGTASGTFDYFTLAVVGTQSSSRKDYTQSEDDTVLVDGVAANPNALAYFGYAYYAANKDKLKLVSVDGGKGCVAPSAEAVANGTYRPLSRPLFIYASRKAMLRPEAKAFAEFYVAPENARHVEGVGYVALPPATLLSVARRLDQNVTGSIFGGQGSVLGVTADTFQDDDTLKSALVR